MHSSAAAAPWLAGDPIARPIELFNDSFLHERVMVESRLMDVFDRQANFAGIPDTGLDVRYRRRVIIVARKHHQ
jgi:hypothetical protein